MDVGSGYKLDMTMMLAVHGALRRDVEQIVRIAALGGDDPRQLLATALGWEQFKKFLHVHHTTEDDVLWPPLERKLADRPDDLDLLIAMEAEHAAIDSVVVAVDAALADPEHGPGSLPGLVDGLVTVLGNHLTHEEVQTLGLIDATLDEAEWTAFGVEHRNRIGDNAPQYLPWVLDGADPELAQALLSHMPPPLVEAYRTSWKVAYAASGRWSGREQPVPS